MCQDIDAMWDAYLTQRLIEHEKRCEPEILCEWVGITEDELFDRGKNND